MFHGLGGQHLHSLWAGVMFFELCSSKPPTVSLHCFLFSGNEYLYKLTSSGNYSLKIILTGNTDAEEYDSVYRSFRIGPEEAGYPLVAVSGNSGTAGDILGLYSSTSLEHAVFWIHGRERNGGRNGQLNAGWWYPSGTPSGTRASRQWGSRTNRWQDKSREQCYTHLNARQPWFCNIEGQRQYVTKVRMYIQRRNWNLEFPCCRNTVFCPQIDFKSRSKGASIFGVWFSSDFFQTDLDFVCQNEVRLVLCSGNYGHMYDRLLFVTQQKNRAWSWFQTDSHHLLTWTNQRNKISGSLLTGVDQSHQTRVMSSSPLDSSRRLETRKVAEYFSMQSASLKCSQVYSRPWWFHTCIHVLRFLAAAHYM